MESSSQQEKSKALYWFLRGILILAFVVLLGRLAELQIIKGKYYRGLAEENRVRRITITAPRGRILARGGEILVGNREVKKSVVFNSESGYEKSNNLKDEEGGEILTEWMRDYPLAAKFAHVSGYLGEANEEEIGKVDPECIQKGPRKLGSYVGRSGLEEYYDCVLRGMDGEELIEVDSKDKKVRVLGKRNPIPGTDIKTTIDYNLQNFVSTQFSGKKGATIITDAKGEILALYSSPSYDPNLFLDPTKNNEITKILNDKSYPLFNRVIAGTYHPGSTFKPVVAIAALQDDIIDKNYTYQDTGKITIQTSYGTFVYSNWYYTQYGGVEGNVNLVRAITRSTDTFFYKLGELVGAPELASWANKFGLDEISGIDLPGEVKGLVPSPEWKEKVKGERWFLGDTYNMSIGQGDLAVTPLALNSEISTIADSGVKCTPHLLKTNSDCKSLNIEKENLDLVKEGMTGVCERGGTGFTFFDFEEKNPMHIKVACKTGTAETSVAGKTHAWFAVFGPVDSPEIIATVLVEEGGEGSSVAGPIARKIFDYWFENNRH